MVYKEFLSKPMFYKKIDFKRMPRCYEFAKSKIKMAKVIHIIGTNGKGSTGRFLAQILMQNGLKVGHYTSPHIMEFNERFWLNGSVVSDDIIESAHIQVAQILGQERLNSLSYFEWATFLASIIFQDCDEIVFEAGMGGEFDATNVFPKKMTIFTPIGLDHTDNLGQSLEEISATKFRAMDGLVLLSDFIDGVSLNVARNIAKSKNISLKFGRDFIDETDCEQIVNYSNKFDLPDFLIANLKLAKAATKFLEYDANIFSLGKLNLAGRCQKIAKNITIDVGHNELGAMAIAKHFKGKKIVLVYNSFLNKDYKKIVQILLPIIKKIEILEYECKERELVGDKIFNLKSEFGIEISKFSQIDNSQEYLVFGSFLLVENFLRQYCEK